MNEFQAPETIAKQASRRQSANFAWRRLAWFTPLLSLIVIVGCALADMQTLFAAPMLLAALTALLAILPAFIISLLFARVFLSNGGPGFLAFGCGALIFAASSLSLLVAAWAWGPQTDINAIVTAHNIGAWEAALCHLGGAAMLERWRTQLKQRVAVCLAAYACAIVAAVSTVFMALAGSLPLFFIQGQGGSLQRQLILGSAIFALALTTSLLRGPASRQRHLEEFGPGDRSPFFEWFILALLMFATSYVGLMLTDVFDGTLSWFSRLSQFVGGFYMLLAAVAAYRQPKTPIAIFRSPRGRAPQRYGVTIAIVLLAFIGRLVFLHNLEMRFPLVTFFPAVMLAALYGGLRAGALATLLCTILTAYFLIDPVGYLSARSGSDRLALAAFVVTSLMLSWLIERLHLTHERLRKVEAARRAELERLVEQRTAELRLEIAERRRAEEASAHLAAIVASSTDAILSKSLDGLVTSWNDGAARLFGYGPDEMIGQPLSRIIPPELIDEERRILDRVAAGEPLDHYETVRMTRDGVRLNVSLTISPIRDAAGTVVSASKIIRDIGDRKRAEQAAIEDRQRVRLATEATGVGIWEWNIFTDKMRWDDQMFRLYGVKPTEDGLVAFETWAATVQPEDLARETQNLRQTALEGGVNCREFRIIRQDNGECRTIEAVETVRINPLGQTEWVVGTNLDVTQRRRAEQALRESEERLRLIGDNLPDSAVFQTTQDAAGTPRFLYISSGIERLNGVSVAEVLEDAEALFSQLSPEARADMIAAGRDSARTMSDVRIEVPMRLPNGEARWMRLHSRPRRTPEGRLIWEGVQTDITAAKAAETALQESKQRFEIALGNSPISVFEQDLDLRYTWIYDQRPDADVDDIIGKTDADFLEPSYVARVGAIKRAVIETGRPSQQDIATAKPGKPIRYFDLHVEPRHDADGRIIGVLCAATDITAARKMRDALQMSQARFRMAMAIGTTVAFTMDRERRFSWVNSNQSGFADENLIGKNLFDVYVEKDAQRLDDLFGNLMERGFGLRRDEEVRSLLQSNPRHLHISAEPLRDETGAIVGLIAAATDVTQRKQVEKALAEAKAEAEQASIAKSKFLAAASHDLRQPVQSLTLLLAVIKRQLVDRPKTTEAVLMAESAVKSLNGLLSGILDISKLDAGVVAPVIASVSIDEIVQRLANEYRPRAAASGLSLRYAPRAFSARTDSALLERVLRNLLENALRYTRQGGILIGLRQRGDCLRIDVIDSGIGIPVDKQSAIFEEFRQLDNPARDSSRGLGLGLAIVSRLADLLNIRIELCSKPEQGSRFSLLLPIDPIAATRIAAEPVLENPGGRVLVIEDNAALRQAFTIMLEDWGYEISSAASGEEAVELAAEADWKFDAILADHRLGPGLTGLKTATKIAQDAGRAIPTMIVTGDTAKERIADLHASGFEMLHKPVSAEDLRLCLGRMLARVRPPQTAP